jgi:hypothetical protein
MYGDPLSSANNGVLHCIVNGAGFWKPFWKSEAVGAVDVEDKASGMWQHALLQLHAIEGLQDEVPYSDADDARANLQRASINCASTPHNSECHFSFMRLSHRRSFKVDPALLEWICFSRSAHAISITTVPVIPPAHILDGRPPSSYLPMYFHLEILLQCSTL